MDDQSKFVDGPDESDMESVSKINQHHEGMSVTEIERDNQKVEVVIDTQVTSGKVEKADVDMKKRTTIEKCKNIGPKQPRVDEAEVEIIEVKQQAERCRTEKKKIVDRKDRDKMLSGKLSVNATQKQQKTTVSPVKQQCDVEKNMGKRGQGKKLQIDEGRGLMDIVNKFDLLEAPKRDDLLETPKKSELMETPKKRDVIETPKKRDLVEIPKKHDLVETPKKCDLVETPKKCDVIETPKKRDLVKTPKKHDLIETPKKRGQEISSSPSKEKSRGDSQGSASKSVISGTSHQKDSNDEWTTDEDEIDSALERKAKKINMTAQNVKSLIHYVLSDKHVKQMFKDALASAETSVSVPTLVTPKKSDPKNPSTESDLNYFPKWTRAKMKDLMEKGNIPLSPAKQQKPGPSILDVDFGEEEDDEEYSPDKDECNETDDESVVSSQMSEFGSPYPRTPGTPVPLRIVEESPVNLSPSVWTTPTSEKDTSKEGLDQTSHENEGTIALRTRSKLPLTDTSLFDIEEAFVAPDITADLYDTNYDDEEWRNFLSNLYKTSDDSVADDDANDPEFNYIAEAEREQLDDEDFRFDKPTKITKKELNTLIEELHNMFDDDEVLPYQVVAGVSDTFKSEGNTSISPHSVSCSASNSVMLATKNYQRKVVSSHQSYPHPSSSQTYFQAIPSSTAYPQFKTPQMPPWQEVMRTSPSSSNSEPVSSIVSASQVDLIKDNMRKHIQLLAQTFLLTHKDQEWAKFASTARNLLTELENLRLSSPVGIHSVFNVCNLDPALLAVNTYSASDTFNVEKNKYQESKSIIYRSPAFLYPQLLPNFKFSRNQKERQAYRNNKFLDSENNLIALGLEQFEGCDGVYPEELIHKLLIRGKTVNQIYHHVRFLSSSIASINAVKKFRRLRQAVELDPPVMDPVDFRAPQEKDLCTLPAWCQEFAQPAKGHKNRSQANLPLQSSTSVFPSGGTLLTSSTSSSLQTHTNLQTPFVLNSSDKNVTCNQLQQTQIVPGTDSKFFDPARQITKHKTLVKQSGRFCKILPSKSIPERVDSEQSNLEAEVQVKMSEVNENDRSDSPLNIDESLHSLSPSHVMASPKDSTSPESMTKTLSFYDSPSVFPHGPPPTSASTPSDPQRTKLPTVRNLGPEFDKHDNPNQSSHEGHNVATTSVNEGNKNTSAHGASFVDPDLIFPHSPPKKISQAPSCRSKISDEASLEDTSSGAKALEKNEPNAVARPSPSPLSCDKVEFSSHKTNTEKVRSVTKAGSINVSNAPSKTLQLTVIEKPSFKATKKTNLADTSDAKSCKEDKTLGDKQETESQNDKEKEDKAIKTKSVVQLAEKDKAKPNEINQPKEVPLSIDKTPEKNVFEMIQENISYANCDQNNAGISDSLTQKDSCPTSDYSVPKESTKSPQAPTFDLVSAKPSSPSVSLESSPVKLSTTVQQAMAGMKTPTKLRPLAPKESLPVQGPAYVPLPKISPKRKELNRQVRHILPKSFVFEAKNPSPTKATAMVLKKKALCQQRSPVKILPRPAPAPPGNGQEAPRGTGLVLRRSTRSRHRKTVIEEKAAKVKKVPRKETEGSETCEIKVSEESKGGAEKEDQIKLEDLMAASTTISFATKQPNVEDDTKGKTKKQRELALLQPDLVESDPKKDEWDIAFAQGYFDQVKEVLKNDPERFRTFLDLLKDMNKNHRSPVELYADIVLLLSDHQQLVEDFAGFLLSFQALECQCFTSSHQINQIRRFLRQIEVHCGSSANTFQKALRALGSWLDMYKEGQENVNVRDKITSILRNIPGVLDDLICYFLDGPLPDCQADDFEDVNLEEDMETEDEFENVVLPNEQENYNTKTCSCQCHSNTQDEKLLRRRKHCVSCSLKMYAGEPILKMSCSEYHPLSVVYPLEEKEKLIKAKKEAAQIALAKAKAQKQKGKKEKPIQKIKSKKTPTEKLKRKKERSRGAVSKKQSDADGTSDGKVKDKPSDPKGTTIKIRIDKGRAKLVTSSRKNSEKNDSDKGDDSLSLSNDQNRSSEPTINETRSALSDARLSPSQDLITDKIPRKSQTVLPKESQSQTSSRYQSRSVSSSVVTRKRQAPQNSQSESLLCPPSKKRALSPGSDTTANEKLDFVPLASSTQNVIGQDNEMSTRVDSVMPSDEENISRPQEFGSGVKSQTAGNQTPSIVNMSAFSEVSVDSSGIPEANEDFDRCILNHMSYDGITEEGVKAVLDLMPIRTAVEIQERAMKLLEMLETMSDATTDLDEEETK